MIENIGITLYQWDTKRKMQSVVGFIKVPMPQNSQIVTIKARIGL